MLEVECMVKSDLVSNKSSSRSEGNTTGSMLVRSDDHRVKRMISATYKVSAGFYYKTTMSAEPASDRCGGSYYVTCRSRSQSAARGQQLQLASGLKDEDRHLHYRLDDTCGHIECITCGEKELKREVSTIMRRFRALARALRAQGFTVPENINDSKYWDHGMFSVPAKLHHKFNTPAGYKAMRARVEKYAQQMGYRAYYIVFHLVHEGEGTARERRDRLEAWQRGEIELELWPHFHIYGLRPDWGTRTTADLYEKTGFVFRSFYSPRCRYRNVYKTLLYEIGHASAPVVDGRSGQIASPVGWLHPSYLSCDVEKLKEPVKCPYCGDEGVKSDERGDAYIGYDGEPVVVMRVTVKRRYYIRDAKADRIEAKGLLPRTGWKRYGSLEWLLVQHCYSRWNLPEASAL